MSKYVMKKISDTLYHITLGRKNVAFIRPHSQGWCASDAKIIKVARNPIEAFNEWCRSANRIALCGKDDKELAQKTLNEDNALARKRVDEVNITAGFPLMRIKTSQVFI